MKFPFLPPSDVKVWLDSSLTPTSSACSKACHDSGNLAESGRVVHLQHFTTDDYLAVLQLTLPSIDSS